MKSKQFLVVTILLVGISALLFCATPDHEKLAKIDAQVNILDTDFAGQYAFQQQSFNKDSGKSDVVVKKAMIFRRDTTNSWLIIMIEPASEKGKAYLKTDNNLWYYDPISKRFTFTNAEDRFQDLNVRNSDFSRSKLAEEYKIVASSQEKLGKFKCEVLNLEAIVKTVTFPKLKIWVSEDNLIRKRQDFSQSGELIRTTAIPSYLKVGSHNVPFKAILMDELRGKTINGKFINDQTTIEVNKPALQKFEDSIFTKAYLEQLGN